MRYAVAIAPENALPSAFVVLRGFREGIPFASRLGYQGIELALRSADDVYVTELGDLLEKHQLEVSAISTGQVFAENGYSFTDRDPDHRARLLDIFYKLIDLAELFGKKVNIGRVRGNLDEHDREGSKWQFMEAISMVCAYAFLKGVDILLEPVNRYELNFINSLEQGNDLLTQLSFHNLYLMPDLFHMNIEDANPQEALKKYIRHIKYLHFADSNRLAPGWGHLDFDSYISLLTEVEYQGWITIEILPEPDPEKAARQAIGHLKSIKIN
jgi:5-keto-L-gluconate epimerase